MGFMHKIQWYANRLKAMNGEEITGHIQKKSNGIRDRFRLPDWAQVDPFSQKGARYPLLKNDSDFPEHLLEELKWETWDLYKGNWKAFGWMDISVADPPEWYKDYMAGVDATSNKWGNQLDHRELPDGADIKLIWELSRWYSLVRMAQGAWLLKDVRLAEVTLRWLQSWERSNVPFKGWNWTSALESGIRLIQLAWIDSLFEKLVWKELDQRKTFNDSWKELKKKLLGPHVYYTWSYRSFGSSANNHLLGELSGLIIALTRWPALAQYTVSLSQLKSMWETEVMTQFAGDGGNKEQALNYQLFSFEFGWQVRNALKCAEIPVRADVEDRLRAAAMFFRNLQVPEEPWDYGDSDSAVVTPLVADASRPVREWWDWLNVPESSPSLHFWLGTPPDQPQKKCGEYVAGRWLLYNDSGQAISRVDDWALRWDLSPLGFLSIAAHGHLDAMHLSIWYRNIAIVVDPGTGAYFGDRKLRKYLASREAHNGPNVPSIPLAKRSGPFLWTSKHPDPLIRLKGEDSLLCQLSTPNGQIKRFISPLEPKIGSGWVVTDKVIGSNESDEPEFSVRWQFAPESKIHESADRVWIIERAGVKIKIVAGDRWKNYRLFVPKSAEEKESGQNRQADDEYEVGEFEGVCSPAFRKVQHGPSLTLRGFGGESCQFTTTFIILKEA